MPMKEAGWLKCKQPGRMLVFLLESNRPSDRKLRLFAIACSRRTESFHLPPIEQAEEQEVMSLAERFADGLATAKALEAAKKCKYEENSTWIVADADAEDVATTYATPIPRIAG